MREKHHYTDRNQQCISFPLGGIGTGCFGLGGNGRFIDWEIFNRPAKGKFNGMSHFAVKAEKNGEVVNARILHGDLQAPFEGPLGTDKFFEGFGWGPMRETLSGLPHFEKNDFEGRFPMADLRFHEEQNFPARLTLTAFNPFIPHNQDDSSIPAAFFVVRVENDSNEELDYTVGSVLANPYFGSTKNSFAQDGNLSGIRLESLNVPEDDLRYGNMSLSTDAEEVSYQEYFYRGTWYDALGVYWSDFSQPGRLENRQYKPVERPATEQSFDLDHGVLAAHFTLKPGESKDIRFLISWYHPTNKMDWKDGINNRLYKTYSEEEMKKVNAPWKNWYATRWTDSGDVARYSFAHWDKLQKETRAFSDAIYESTLPESVREAVGANLAIFKSPSMYRLEDGTLYSWEGAGEKAGSCEGSCTHVWAYAQSLPYLFPALARSMREAEFTYNWRDNGDMAFRLLLPLGIGIWPFRAAIDGHYATIIKVFREWRISGDTEWLKKLWPRVKKSIEFAWDPDNEDQWDPGKTGILTGRQHHTLDMELFTENSWLTGMYLAGLKAGSFMAEALGDSETAQEYLDVFAKGCKALNDRLYNGEYYVQNVDMGDKSVLAPYENESESVAAVHGKRSIYDMYWSEEHEELKYQYGEGCALDQMIGQWHADVNGLGDIFDPDQALSALKAMFKYNFVETMRDHANPCRIYALNDESGITIMSFPEGVRKPKISVPYAEETFHGFEYASADLMIRRGMKEEGLRIVQSVRDRYNGERRNPWSEMECGQNYVRSMASFALLLTFSGFRYDRVENALSFQPLEKKDGSYMWTYGEGWGRISRIGGVTILKVEGGRIDLSRITLDEEATSIVAGGKTIGFKKDDDALILDETVALTEGQVLVIS